MKLEIQNDDPLKVLTSTRVVVEKSEFVAIDEERIQTAAKAVEDRFAEGVSAAEMGLKISNNLEKDVQLFFLEDVVNFCFWAGKNESKWQVEQLDGTATQGGWFSLKTSFERALAEGVPILDAEYLSTIALEDVRRIFRGINGTEIPLLEERTKNLREAGMVLCEKFAGRFLNVIKDAGHDAVRIVEEIVKSFPSFRDISKFDGHDIFFLKRAQICVQDLDYIFKTIDKSFSRIKTLTAFADYKVPQILRMFGILKYADELAGMVDNYIELRHDSREEIEIRAATIWAVELIRQKTRLLTAVEIDNTLWLMSQDIQNRTQPYHRTRTIFY